MDNLNNQKTMNADSIFGKRFLNSKSLYLYCFNALPSIHFIGNINGEKAYKALKKNLLRPFNPSTRYVATTGSESNTSLIIPSSF